MAATVLCKLGLHRWQLSGYDHGSERAGQTCERCGRQRERRTGIRAARDHGSDYTPW